MPDRAARPALCEEEVRCPALACGRVLVRYRCCRLSQCRHFEGAYDPRTLQSVELDGEWERWFERVLAWRRRDAYLEVRPPVPLATEPAA